jgi:hypothetical protein
MNVNAIINHVKDQSVRRALKAIYAQLIADLDANKAAYAAHSHRYGSTKVLSSGAWAAKATADPDIKTTANIYYVNSGEIKTIAAGNVDVSGVAGYTPTALATAKQRFFLITVNLSTDALAITEGADHASAAVMPATPSGHLAVGWVKVVNGSGSNFTFGTTNTDTGSVTCTYGNLSKDDGVLQTSVPDTTAAGFTRGTASTFSQNLTI